MYLADGEARKLERGSDLDDGVEGFVEVGVEIEEGRRAW